MEFIASLEKHYSGIGKKIKRWAIWIFVIEAIAAIIAGIIGCVIFCDWGGDDGGYLWASLCILAIPLAILIEFVCTWLLYAFGDMVDNLQIVAKKLDPESFESMIKESPENKQEKPFKSGWMSKQRDKNYYCPSCDERLRYGDAECPGCGQKLDWS